MRKSIATAIVARRLNLPDGRSSALVQRASEGSLLPTAAGSAVPDLGDAELATLFIAVVADRGLGNVSATVRDFSALTNDRGDTLHATLTALFSHGPALAGAATGSLIVRLDPATASLTVGGIHARYGPEPPPSAAGKHVLVPGQTLAAIGLELQGHSASDADALVALALVSASASVGHAMHPVPR